MGFININELLKPLLEQYNLACKKIEEYKNELEEIENFEDSETFKDEEWKLLQSIYSEIDKDILVNFERIVGDWYSSYSPITRGYSRRGDLKDAITVDKTDTKTKMIIHTAWGKDSKDMPSGQRGVDAEYMDKLAFKGGYHGGATKGPDHPAPGTPYYRNLPNFKNWSRPAVSTFPIDDEMNAWADLYMKDKQKMYDDGLASIYKKYGY